MEGRGNLLDIIESTSNLVGNWRTLSQEFSQARNFFPLVSSTLSLLVSTGNFLIDYSKTLNDQESGLATEERIEALKIGWFLGKESNKAT